MLSSLRLPALATLLLAGAVTGCAMPQSSSPGYGSGQSPSAGFNLRAQPAPYTGHILSKCDDLTDAFQRSNCHVMEREEIEKHERES